MDFSLSASITFCLKNERKKSYKSRQGLTLEVMVLVFSKDPRDYRRNVIIPCQALIQSRT